ncbi:hypothetical protein GCM10019016_091290 [Streptomyces prasinosporus]|uniref:Uncharacterized protein n=1 Tax=Streptomyces prasinosporus TaxID=68256 RepID=A0ABP6U6B6_9ACTN
MVQHHGRDHAGAEQDQDRRADDFPDEYVCVAHGGSWAPVRDGSAPDLTCRVRFPRRLRPKAGRDRAPPGVRDERAVAAGSPVGEWAVSQEDPSGGVPECTETYGDVG